MEFSEKLQELRKKKNLTQEELANALYVSRTAISKWESGRGYPSIDSLKEISRYFCVSIDELICADEIVSAAVREKLDFKNRYISLISCVFDILLAVLFVIPVFGNGADTPVNVALFGITGLQVWVKVVFAVLIGITVLNGICGAILTRFDKPLWNWHRIMTGVWLLVLCVIVFIITRQPYAGIICFVTLAIKVFLILKLR